MPNLPPTVYIAGRYRGVTPWEVQQNVRAAEDWAAWVWQHGGAASCPQKNTEHFDKMLPDEVFLLGTEALLRTCHVALFIPNWTHSAGSRHELGVCRSAGIPHFFAEPCVEAGRGRHLQDLIAFLAPTHPDKLLR